MNIKYMIANAVVRRVVYIVLAVVATWAGCDKAHASCTATSESAFQCTDEGEARSAAQASAQARMSAFCAGQNGIGLEASAYKESNYWQAQVKCVASWDPNTVLGTWQIGAPIWRFTSGCSVRPPLTEGWYQMGQGPLCHNGCAYSGSGGGTGNISGVTLNPGTPQESTVERTSGGHTPTGATCATSAQSPSPITQPVCSTVGTLTQCVRPDGKHCATASTGKQFCWSPSENGVKQEGNEGATKAPPSTEVKPPANPPPNGGDWQQAGQGSVTINHNGTTTTSTVTNWSSSYGNQGTGGGSTNGDGSENGNGNGNGNGSGDGDGDGDGPGTPTGESLGDLYTPTDKTVESVFQNFWNAAQTTAVFNQINAFFGNCGYGGACPSLTYENEYMGRLSFTQLCDGTIADILTFGGFVVLAMGAFAGFRIGVY